MNYNNEILIGTVFKMQDNLWEVKTTGENGCFGVQCLKMGQWGFAFTTGTKEEIEPNIVKLLNQ